MAILIYVRPVGMLWFGLCQDVDSRTSVAGWSTFLFETPFTERCKTEAMTTLSAKVVFVAVDMCAQYVLVSWELVTMELKAKKPMVLRMDDKAAKDYSHNWSVGGRARHMDVGWHFLRESKEEGLNIFTKTDCDVFAVVGESYQQEFKNSDGNQQTNPAKSRVRSRSRSKQGWNSCRE